MTFKQDAIMDIFNLNEKVEGLFLVTRNRLFSHVHIGLCEENGSVTIGNMLTIIKWQSFSDVEPTLKEL